MFNESYIEPRGSNILMVKDIGKENIISASEAKNIARSFEIGKVSKVSNILVYL